jgi:restriction endonuclease S subunit
MVRKNEIMSGGHLPSNTMAAIINSQAKKTSFFEKIHNLLWNEAGLNPEKALEHMMFFFAFRLIDPCVQTLGLPECCSWKHISSLTDPIEVDIKIKESVGHFRRNEITRPFFNKHDIERPTTVKLIVEVINENITDAELVESDVLGDIFEYMLGRGISTMADDGQYFTNRLICKKTFDLAYKIKGSLRRADGSLCTFADFFCGTGGFTTEYIKGAKAHLHDLDWEKDKTQIYCTDKNMSSVTTTLLNCLIQTHVPFSNSTIRDNNSFMNPITIGLNAPFPGLAVDYMLTNPPYGGDKDKGKDYKFCYVKETKNAYGKKEKIYNVNQEIRSIGIEDDVKVSAGVQLAMATLSPDGGVAAMVLPQGFFCNSDKKLVELRKRLAEEYKIHYVVDIAARAFANTGTKTSMVVFQRGVGATDHVKFMDMDDNLLVEVPLADLQKKKYSLNYKVYKVQEQEDTAGFEWVRLGDVVTFRGGKYTTTFARNNPGVYQFYSGKAEQPDGTCKEYCFDGSQYIILIKDGGSGHGIYSDKIGLGKTYLVSGKTSCTSHNVGLFSSLDTVSMEYIYYVLQMSRNRIMDLAEYTTGLGVINQEKLSNFIIPLPCLDKQQEIVDAIHTWASLAHAEEASLKLLEKGIMNEVKTLGREAERVRLGDVCEIDFGARITKQHDTGTTYPVYGGGDVTFHTDAKNRSGITCKISRFGISEKNVVQILYKDYWLLDSGFTVTGVEGKSCSEYLWYWLLNNKPLVYACGRQTAQMNMDINLFKDLLIPLPSHEQQQTLQPLFDEVKHKHAKIAEYKAKADTAIKAYIPGANPNQAIEEQTPAALPVELKVEEETASVVSSNTSKMSVADLKAQCKTLGIKGITGKKKAELIAMIEQH